MGGRFRIVSAAMCLRVALSCRLGLVFIALLATMAFDRPAAAQALAAVAALGRRDCEAAIDALNKGMADNDANAFYLAGQMFQSGVCLRQDLVKAADVYQQAAVAGETGSARELALLNARGAGVAQSYARAGYWFAVVRHEQPITPTPMTEAYATPGAVAKTYVEAIHDLAEDEIDYPDEAAVQGVRGAVVMHFDPRSGIATVVSSSDNKGISATHFGPSRHLFEHVLAAAYDRAIRELPKPSLPDAVDYSSDRRVVFERDRNNRRPGKAQYDLR